MPTCAGLRASLALLLGAVTLAAGAVPVVDATRGGSLARDLTGFMLLPTGVALLAIGAGVLWASRKRGRTVWWRLGRRSLLAVAALLVVH